MGRKIEDISIFGEYKQPENRLTAAFLQICKIGTENLLRYISQKINLQLPSSDISITSQAPKQHSVPDGLLQSSFAFRLYIESKIHPNSIDLPQLENHQKMIKTPNDYLLYLTPDVTKPPSIPDNVYWVNWIDLSQWLNQYLQTSRPDNAELLEFLIQNFDILLGNMGLMDTGWDLNNDQVLIVAGKNALGIAHKFGYYICQNKRSFRPSSYIVFYTNNQIDALFEILEDPKDDCNLKLIPELSSYLTQVEPEYTEEDLRRVFRINFVEEINPIINDSIDKHGKPCPFTYGQPRYSSLSKINSATKTSHLI